MKSRSSSGDQSRTEVDYSWKTDRQTDNQTDNQTGRHTDREPTDRQSDREPTDRQTDRGFTVPGIMSLYFLLTSSMPLISRIAPRTRENTPVPRIHSLVRPPFRTEGALSAGKRKNKMKGKETLRDEYTVWEWHRVWRVTYQQGWNQGQSLRQFLYAKAHSMASQQQLYRRKIR